MTNKHGSIFLTYLDLCLTLFGMGYFANLFGMGGANMPPPPWLTFDRQKV